MKKAILGIFLLSAVMGYLNAEERTKAPDFALPYYNSSKDTLKLSDFQGKVVILDFWATWCKPCRMEIPGFIELYKAYKDSGFVMVGVALDRPQKVARFYEANKMNYPVVIGNNSIAKAYGGIMGIPTTFVIDKNGRIYRKYVGYRPLSLFKNDITALLKEPYEEDKSKGEDEAKKTK